MSTLGISIVLSVVLTIFLNGALRVFRDLGTRLHESLSRFGDRVSRPAPREPRLAPAPVTTGTGAGLGRAG